VNQQKKCTDNGFCLGFISAASNRQKKNENTTLEDWAAELEQELLALENYLQEILPYLVLNHPRQIPTGSDN